MRVAALAGGAGAARFLRGVAGVVAPADLTVIGNTGDDEVIHGLYVCPDLDIVTYTLAGQVADSGWGFQNDTNNALGMLARYGFDTWFGLGDRDIGTHLARTHWLNEGMSLSDCASKIAAALGVGATMLPMSNDRVRTLVTTPAGTRSFQEYFVRLRHSEEVLGVSFEGAESARPVPGAVEAIRGAEIILVCPSNPVASIGPILAVPGLADALAERRSDVIAVSPIVRRKAFKGPAVEMLVSRGVDPSAEGVAGLYRHIAAHFVLDLLDRSEQDGVRRLGLNPILLDTVMSTPEKARRLAREILSAHSDR